MPFQPPPRPASVLASVLAAGLMLTAVSCSHITPLGPAAPQPSQLTSPFALEALGIQAPRPAGGCPAGSVALSGGPGQCYRELATPVTITSAAISQVAALPQNHSPGMPASPPSYGFTITLTTSETPALTAVTTTAAGSHGYLGITAAGRTWLFPQVIKPFPGPRFSVLMPGKNQVLQFQRILAPSG
jgi:hypothetical protein